MQEGKFALNKDPETAMSMISKFAREMREARVYIEEDKETSL